MLYLVSYDLRQPNRDYRKLYELLKTAPRYHRCLESVWLLSTNESVSTWTKRLRRVMDHNDLVIVVDITHKDRNGWLLPEAWTWLAANDH